MPSTYYGGIIGAASNIRGGTNPAYDMNDFKAVYPQFFEPDKKRVKVRHEVKPILPEEVLEMYISFAHSCIKEARYHEGWKLCMGLFVAHFATLYLRTMTDPGSTAADVLKAGQIKGLAASKSVDGISVSYDFTVATQGLENWAAWTTTEYGIQFATLAKMYRPRSIYIP